MDHDKVHHTRNSNCHLCHVDNSRICISGCTSRPHSKIPRIPARYKHMRIDRTGWEYTVRRRTELPNTTELWADRKERPCILGYSCTRMRAFDASSRCRCSCSSLVDTGWRRLRSFYQPSTLDIGIYSLKKNTIYFHL